MQLGERVRSLFEGRGAAVQADKTFRSLWKRPPATAALATRFTVKSGLLHEKVTSDLWCREAPLEGC